MARVFLSVGSNLGDRLGCLRRAAEHPRHLQARRFLDPSPLYRPEPWERPPGRPDEDAGWFFNCAVVIETDLPPATLLARLQAVEEAMGRGRRGGAPGGQ